jgi:hypothetical protein
MTLDKDSLAVWHAGSRATESVAREIEATFPSPNDVGTYAGHGEVYDSKRGTLTGVANHGQYAIDRMIGSRAEGDRIAAWAWANRKRLGIRYVIWYRRIISETNTPSQWRTYTNPVASRRGTASGDHTNHVHISRFSNKDYTGPAGTTVPVPKLGDVDYVPGKPWVFYLDRQAPGVKDSDSIVLLQRKLELTPTGAWSDELEQHVKAWQLSIGDDPRYCDGILGAAQAARLFGSDVKIEAKA